MVDADGRALEALKLKVIEGCNRLLSGTAANQVSDLFECLGRGPRTGDKRLVGMTRVEQIKVMTKMYGERTLVKHETRVKLLDGDVFGPEVSNMTGSDIVKRSSGLDAKMKQAW
uniref:Uncharacterized protein n=1 Tax=Ditylenchus dipsaci TaxID=166011 RepID=A0A915CK32_9BILA